MKVNQSRTHWVHNPVVVRRSNRLRNLLPPLSQTIIITNSRATQITNNPLSQANAPFLLFPWNHLSIKKYKRLRLPHLHLNQLSRFVVFPYFQIRRFAQPHQLVRQSTYRSPRPLHLATNHPHGGIRPHRANIYHLRQSPQWTAKIWEANVNRDRMTCYDSFTTKDTPWQKRID